MSNYVLEKLPGESIVVITASVEWRATADMQTVTRKTLALLNDQNEPIYFIADMTKWRPDLMDLIKASNDVARNRGSVIEHPNFKGLLVVSPLHFVELAAQGMNSEAFKYIQVKVFQTIQEALDYARKEVHHQAVV